MIKPGQSFGRPRPGYDSVFAQLGDEPEAYSRTGDRVALRFTDPEHRADASGRPIPNEFVILEPLSHQIHLLEDGKRLVWKQARDEYALVWDQQAPPTPKD